MISERFSANLDSFGLITKAGDGGDTCSRHCTALYCLQHSAEEVEHALSLLQVDGIPRRHPDTDKWYHRVNTTSRDQLIPYLCLTATPSKVSPEVVKQHFLALAAQHAKRLFLFTWNTKRNFRYPTPEEHALKSTPDVPYNYSSKLPDLCFMNVWAVYVRGFMHHTMLGKLLSPLLYIVLNVLDLHKFLDMLILLVSLDAGKHIGPTWQKNAIDHDMQNSTLCIHYAATNYPTLLSWLTWKLYKPHAIKAAESFFQQPDEPRLDLAITELD